MLITPEILKEIHSYISLVLNRTEDINNIKSLRITERQPLTERLYFQLPSDPTLRVCLHVFHPADADDCFPHPHAWEAEVILLNGFYKHWIKSNVPFDFNAKVLFGKGLASTILAPGSTYHMDTPFMWHKVQPLTVCHTLMVNKPTWRPKSQHCKFTKGEEVVEMSVSKKLIRLRQFKIFLENFETIPTLI